MNPATRSISPDDPPIWRQQAAARLSRSGIDVKFEANGQQCRLNGRLFSCWQFLRLAGFRDRLELFGMPGEGVQPVGDLGTPEERAITVLRSRSVEVLRWSFNGFLVDGKVLGPWELYELAGFASPADLTVEHPVFRRIDPVIAAFYLWDHYGIPCLRIRDHYLVDGKPLYPESVVSMALDRWVQSTGQTRPAFKASISGDNVRSDLIANRSRATYREGIHSPPAGRPARSQAQGAV